MKVKQKKLKAENFRYVLKRVIKNPMIYLNDFFGYQHRIDNWMRTISLTINRGAYPKMACHKAVESGFYCKELIEHVEVAYIIYKQCRLKKQRNPVQFFKTRDDYFAYVLSGEYSFDGQINPGDTLSKFFSFQPLKKWYETLDDIMLSLTQTDVANYDRFGDRIVVIHELLLRLAQAMYVIHREGGLPLQVPSYVIAKPSDTFEGKMPLSKLGELIHGIADERQAEAVAELEPIFEKAELWDKQEGSRMETGDESTKPTGNEQEGADA